MLKYGTEATCDVCGIKAFHETGCTIVSPSNWGSLSDGEDRTILCPKCLETVKNCVRTMIAERDIYRLR